MSPKKLFLSHFNRDASAIQPLACELRLRGVVPWVDKQGGFSVGDESEKEARRAIQEDCFGLLLFATKDSFSRWFIKEVEIPAAISAREKDPTFILFATPSGISFDELSDLSSREFSFDLSRFHTVPIHPGDAFIESCQKVAADVLDRLLTQRSGQIGDRLSLQFSTREVLPNGCCDMLCINAVPLFRDGLTEPENWHRLIAGLVDIKNSIAAHYGRPVLCVHGSKHLTSAFVFGRVFAQFELEIRQTPTVVWKNNVPVAHPQPLSSAVIDYSAYSTSGALFVEIASRGKNIAAGVDCFVEQNELIPSARLQLYPPSPTFVVDNGICVAMVEQTYNEIERVVREHEVSEIHLFAAAPQSFMMMLGQKFRGMPPVHLYEWVGDHYTHSCAIPGTSL